jgi:putative transposase
LAGRVLVKIVYLLTCQVLGLARLVFRCDLAKDAELLVLGMRTRYCGGTSPGAVRHEPADRAWFAALARLVPRKRWPGSLPATLPSTSVSGSRTLSS